MMPIPLVQVGDRVVRDGLAERFSFIVRGVYGDYLWDGQDTMWIGDYRIVKKGENNGLDTGED